MTRISNSRTYRSKLREEQAEATRARILDATGPLMARGVASLSIPAVAREAGVSVPTVYRHFATKQRAHRGDLPARHAAGRHQPAATAALDHRASGRCARVPRAPGFARRPGACRHGKRGRGRGAASRACQIELAMFRELADSVEPKLADADRDRIARLLVVLTQSSSLRMWRDHLGLSVDEVADEIDWVVEGGHRGRNQEERTMTRGRGSTAPRRAHGRCRRGRRQGGQPRRAARGRRQRSGWCGPDGRRRRHDGGRAPIAAVGRRRGPWDRALRGPFERSRRGWRGPVVCGHVRIGAGRRRR